MSRILRYAKLAEEATHGTEPASPDITTDIASATLDAPSDTQLTWEGGIGRAPRTTAAGYYSPSGNVAVAVDVETVAHFLKWALGGYIFTDSGGTNGLHLHEAYGVHELVLPSFTTWLGKDVFEHVFTGCVASQLTLEVSDGFLQATMDVMARKDSKQDVDEDVVASLPLAPPIAFPSCRLWIGGTAPGDEESAEVESLTLTVANNADSTAARGLGSRFGQRPIPAGQRETTIQATFWYDDTHHLERLWGGATEPSPDGPGTVPFEFVGSSGDSGTLTLRLPKAEYRQVQTQPSGRSRMTQQINATALLDTVTLEDSTDVETDVYARVENDQDEVVAA